MNKGYQQKPQKFSHQEFLGSPVIKQFSVPLGHWQAIGSHTTADYQYYL